MWLTARASTMSARRGALRAGRWPRISFARIGEGALVKSFTLALDGILTRNEAVMTLKGDGGTAHVAGVALGDGDMHHDDTVFITHEGLGCESRQVFKKVLRNGATGVFQGKILVRRGGAED